MIENCDALECYFTLYLPPTSHGSLAATFGRNSLISHFSVSSVNKMNHTEASQDGIINIPSFSECPFPFIFIMHFWPNVCKIIDFTRIALENIGQTFLASYNEMYDNISFSLVQEARKPCHNQLILICTVNFAFFCKFCK